MSAREVVVSVVDVWKRFKSKTALRGVSLSVRRGELVYLLGPNGAGKTTLVRVMLGLYKPTVGRVEVMGVTPGGRGWERVKVEIGYVPENADVYERLTGFEFLEFYAKLYGGSRWRELVERGVEISGLRIDDLYRRAGEYSRGMRRRLLLAAALMLRPRLLVLDEPFSGVDVISAYRMKRRLKQLSGEGVTVIATSHNILEAEKLADRIVFLYEGRVLYVGTVRGALEKYGASSLEEAFTYAAGGL